MRWLSVEGIKGAIIGGVAASIVGRPRMTADVDAVILVDDSDWERVAESASHYGLMPRRADLLAFAARTRVLLLRHTASGIDVDISLGALPFEHEVVARALAVNLKDLDLRIATGEDLVIMKALPRRPHDIADIEGILVVHPDLDLARIRDYLREFSSALEMPEIQDDFERLLRRVRRS